MNPARAIFLKLMSVAIFVVMQALIKSVSGHIPAGEVVFFRSFFAFPVIFVWLWHQGELSVGWRTSNPMGHVWRGFMGTAAMGLGFAGLGFLPLPEVTAIGYATPLLVVIFAAMFLNEEVRIFRLTAVAMGLVGVLIVLSPRIGAIHDVNTDARQALGAMLVLGSALCAALAQVFVRKMVQVERTAAIVFWFTITSTVISLFTLPWGWVVPTAQEATLLVLCGLLGGAGQICLTFSYRYGDASLVAPFDYASMLLALGIGYFIFDEVPTMIMLGGASLVIAAGVLIIWRERKLGLERNRQRKAMTPQG